MSVSAMGVRSASDNSAASSSSGTSSSKVSAKTIKDMNTLDQDEFMKLLTTELSNQDPTNPQDEKDMLAQLAQFSTVQGVTSLSDTMQQVQGAGMLGVKVTAIKTLDDGSQQAVSGTVTKVLYKTDGVHFTVNDTDITMGDIQQIG